MGGVLSLKKGLAAIVLIFLGIYAAQTVGSNPQTIELLKRFAGENKLTAAGLRLELGSDNESGIDETDGKNDKQDGQ